MIEASDGSRGLPKCSVLEQVRVCVQRTGQVIDPDQVQRVIDLVLTPAGEGLRPYPPVTLHLLDNGALRVLGYYLDPSIILIANLEAWTKDDDPTRTLAPAIYAVIAHELWHHRLTNWGVPVDEQHCVMGRSKEYAGVLKQLNPNDVIDYYGHIMTLLTQCAVFSYPED